ncbi:MAG: HIT domain-containing protein [Chloroflexi bacterium]|nr:MAG: HIT domain-containing protein [Chloroflexota bacterium]
MVNVFYRLGRVSGAGWLLRFGVRYMHFAIPLNRLRETATLLAFHHPSPSYPVHVLIVPKRAYASLLDLDPADAAFQRDLFETVRSLVNEFCLAKSGYRLIANGGAYQDAPILHFHLIAEQ